MYTCLNVSNLIFLFFVSHETCIYNIQTHKPDTSHFYGTIFDGHMYFGLSVLDPSLADHVFGAITALVRAKVVLKWMLWSKFPNLNKTTWQKGSISSMFIKLKSHHWYPGCWRIFYWMFPIIYQHFLECT